MIEEITIQEKILYWLYLESDLALIKVREEEERRARQEEFGLRFRERLMEIKEEEK